MTISLNGAAHRLDDLESKIAPDPDRPYFDELQKELSTLSKDEKIAWLSEQIDSLEAGILQDFLIDWKDVLQLQGDRRKDTMGRNLQLDRWHELQERWGWPASWTGWGIPPQMRGEI